jgi:hypothetical protein
MALGSSVGSILIDESLIGVFADTEALGYLAG